jgi:hypothetical protein
MHLVFVTFLNEKKLARASNPHLSFNRPLPVWIILDVWYVYFVMQCNGGGGPFIAFSRYVSSVDNAVNILWEDDGEDKDDSDWVTENDSVMSDDGESGE